MDEESYKSAIVRDRKNKISEKVTEKSQTSMDKF